MFSTVEASKKTATPGNDMTAKDGSKRTPGKSAACKVDMCEIPAKTLKLLQDQRDLEHELVLMRADVPYGLRSAAKELSKTKTLSSTSSSRTRFSRRSTGSFVAKAWAKASQTHLSKRQCVEAT
jgi:hypothetical protein